MSKSIIFILGSMAGGGAERVMSNLAQYYSERGYNVKIITLLNDKIGYELPHDVVIRHLSTDNAKPPLKPLMWVKKLRHIFKLERPDIIVSFFCKINLLVLISSLGLRTPVFISERNDPKSDNRSSLITLLTYLIYPLSKGIIFQTEHAKACFPKIIQRKSIVLPNPINIKFNFERDKKLTKTIVAVGKLMEQKNHVLLISAFRFVLKDFPDYRLHIYGDGPLKDFLNETIRRYEIQDSVILKGKTNDIFNVVYNADLFVLSSNYEGLSNALIEAMFLETPVISTRCAGSTELIEDGISGRLVSIGDSRELADAIIESITDYSHSVSMAENGKRAVEGFTAEKICVQWSEFLKV